MEIKKIILVVIIFVCYNLNGQELKLSTSSQYLADNPYVVAAAFAGIGEFYQLRLSAVSQWVGVKNAPETQSVSFDARIADRSGVGIILYNDVNRFTHQKGGQVSYAHHLTLNEYNNSFLSLGLSYKFTNFNIDISDIKNGTSDPRVQEYNTFNSNFDVSVLYRIGKFYTSLNAVNILDKTVQTTLKEEPVKLRNYYLYSGAIFKDKMLDIEYEPSILYQYFESDGRSSADLNFKVRKMYNDNYIWAGLSVRLLGDQSFKPNSIAPLVGIKKGMFYAAYSFEANLNKIQSYNSGTHMISIGFDFLAGNSSCSCAY